MMQIDIITCLPELLHSPLQHSIMKRAQEKDVVRINIHQLRDYASGKHRQTDDYAYGGGAGMVMMPEPLFKCIANLKASKSYDEIIYLSPDGQTLDQQVCNKLSMKGNLMLICGHYKGIDQRVRDHLVTMEISIGDYVLSGGELAALVLTDAIVRLLPGVLNDETSALTDTFQDGLLAPPVYTRPADYNGLKVPEVLLSGNDKSIEEWRMQQSLSKTKRLRPDLYKKWSQE